MPVLCRCFAGILPGVGVCGCAKDSSSIITSLLSSFMNDPGEEMEEEKMEDEVCLLSTRTLFTNLQILYLVILANI